MSYKRVAETIDLLKEIEVLGEEEAEHIMLKLQSAKKFRLENEPETDFQDSAAVPETAKPENAGFTLNPENDQVLFPAVSPKPLVADDIGSESDSDSESDTQKPDYIDDSGHCVVEEENKKKEWESRCKVHHLGVFDVSWESPIRTPNEIRAIRRYEVFEYYRSHYDLEKAETKRMDIINDWWVARQVFLNMEKAKAKGEPYPEYKPPEGHGYIFACPKHQVDVLEAILKFEDERLVDVKNMRPEIGECSCNRAFREAIVIEIEKARAAWVNYCAASTEMLYAKHNLEKATENLDIMVREIDKAIEENSVLIDELLIRKAAFMAEIKKWSFYKEETELIAKKYRNYHSEFVY